MTIPAGHFVDVIPSVLNAGGTALDLQALMLTTSTRVPIGAVQAFDDATGVEDYFGPDSHEAAVATVYFNGFDNSTAKPASVLFAQYNESAVAAYLRGGSVAGLTLSQLQAITGTLTVTMDGYAHVISDVDLSAATSFSNAATTLEGAFSNPTEATCSLGTISGTVLTVAGTITGVFAVGQTISGESVTAGTIITSLGSGAGGAGTYNLSASSTVGSGEAITATATPIVVTYDSVSGAFLFTSGITSTASTSAFATGTAAAALMTTSATGAVISQGAAAASPISFMDGILNITQNWATFMTTFDPDNGSGNAQKLLFAEWANGEDDNYAYVAWDTDASPTTQVPASESLGALIKANNYSGTYLAWEPNDQFQAAFVCGFAASLDFQQTNGRATIAGKHLAGLTAGVTSINVASNLEANGYNYYGATATAAQGFVFEYPGTISGPFQWFDSYINQIWMRNQFQLALMELLTTVNSIPYNSAGYAMIESACLDTINQAVNFGAIRAGVTLSSAQITEVNTAAGANIAPTLNAKGWYLQVLDATPQVRQARGSPPINFWYMDGQSVQKIVMNSILVQ